MDALRIPLLTVGLRTTPGWTAGYVVILLVTGAAPVGIALVIGQLIALTADSAAAGGILRAAAAFAVLFLVAQAGGFLLSAYADVFGGRLQAAVEARAIAGFGRIDVSDAALADMRSVCESSVVSRQYVIATASYQMVRLQAVLPGLLLVVLAPLPGLLALAAYLFCSYALERQYDEEQAAAYAEADASARPNYLSGLALDRAAAREMKVFDAADWVIGRFREAADAASPPPVRHRSGGLVPAYAGVLLSTAFLLAWLIRPSPGLSAEQVAVGAAALVSLTQIFAVSMDVVYSRTGAGYFRRADRVVRAVARTVPSGTAPSPTVSSVLRFDKVGFRYPGSPEPVFVDLSFSVALGQSLAIVGVNGAGKSTLVRLMTGILGPDTGRITCDGVDISSDPAVRDAWRRHVAFLGQQFVRYPASLADNVGLGDLEPSDWAPAVHELLTGVDGTLVHRNTVLANGVPGGVELSGGQWQKVATARAISRLDPATPSRVLVLDEPTAALDAESESRFFTEMKQLSRGAVGTVMVSHRLAGIRTAEEILVLDGGRILERGNHSGLMAEGGVYSTMFMAQAGRYGA